MGTSIEAVFKYRPDEYVRAMRRHFKTKLSVGRDIVVGVFAIAAGLYVYQSTRNTILTFGLVAVGAVLLAMVGYAVLILPSLVYRSQPKLKSEYTLTFSDDAIRFKTDEIDSVLKWSLYHSWLRDDEFYILYHGKRDLSVVPRRVLASPETDGQLASLLTSKIGPALS
jgi:hypothetical protein